MRIVLFAFFMLLNVKTIACSSLEERAIRCDQHCVSNGDKESWLKDNKICVCGEVSTPEKSIFKIRSNQLNGQVVIDKKPIYYGDGL